MLKNMDLQIKCEDVLSPYHQISPRVLGETQKRNSNNSYISPLDPYLSWKRNLSYRQN